jgi:hypothetical protein
MGSGPRVAAVVHDSAAQHQLRDPVPGPHQITADVIPGTHQVTSRLLLDRPHRHRDDLIQAQIPQCLATLNRSPAGLGQDRRSQSKSMTALGTPASVSRSPTTSATEVLPAPTVPLISSALHELLGGMGTRRRYEF